MKKFLCIFLLLVLAYAVMLCSCTNDGNNEETADSKPSQTDTAEITETAADKTSETEDTLSEAGGMSYNENENEDSADFSSLFN